MAHREEERGDELRQKDRPGRLSEPHGPVSDGPLSVVVSRLLMDGLAEAKATRHHSGLKLRAFQAEEVRTLATKVAADMAEPTKAHMTRSMDDVSKTS